MIGGVLRVVAGLLATMTMFTFYGVVLPIVAMAIALYVVRMWPLTKRRP